MLIYGDKILKVQYLNCWFSWIYRVSLYYYKWFKIWSNYQQECFLWRIVFMTVLFSTLRNSLILFVIWIIPSFNVIAINSQFKEERTKFFRSVGLYLLVLCVLGIFLFYHVGNFKNYFYSDIFKRFLIVLLSFRFYSLMTVCPWQNNLNLTLNN